MDDAQESPGVLRRCISYMKNLYHSSATHLVKVHHHNLRTFRRQTLAEISGSFGDLGTLLPLLIALTAQNAVSLSATLVFSGLANIFTGLTFGIPLPVQPMKAIAAVAIAQDFTIRETVSAGIFVAAAIALLSLTGLIRWFTDVIPLPVIKGIQLGTGLSLIIAAGPIYDHTTEGNWIVFLAFLGLLITSTLYKRLPYALIVLIIGIIVVIIFHPSGKDYIPYPVLPEDTTLSTATDSSNKKPWLSIWRPQPTIPDGRDFVKGVAEAGIGQLPLTTLNSVIAVSFLAADLFPASSTTVPRPSPTAIGLSVSLANLIGCWFGAMPICHGSGGLAAQYRFGARSGASVIFLGTLKLLLGLFASRVADVVAGGFPGSLLCMLLVAAGLELSLVGEGLNTGRARDLADSAARQRREGRRRRELLNGRAGGRSGDGGVFEGGDEENANDGGQEHKDLAIDLSESERKRRWTVMLMTVGGILAFKNDAVGFVAGMLCHWFYRWQGRWEEGRAGRIRLDTEEGRQGEAAA